MEFEMEIFSLKMKWAINNEETIVMLLHIKAILKSIFFNTICHKKA